MGQPVRPLRWVLVRAPEGRLAPRASCSTCTHERPRTVVPQFTQRWRMETTFEERRAHLGLETQRQWSDRAIERTTPCLLGLDSVVAWLAHALYPDGKVPAQRAAWYPKNRATCADVLATRCGLVNIGRRPRPGSHPTVGALTPGTSRLLHPLTWTKSS